MTTMRRAMPEATVLYSVTAVVVAGLVVWVAVVLKTAKEPWIRAVPPRSGALAPPRARRPRSPRQVRVDDRRGLDREGNAGRACERSKAEVFRGRRRRLSSARPRVMASRGRAAIDRTRPERRASRDPDDGEKRACWFHSPRG